MNTVIFTGELDKVLPEDVVVTCQLANPLNTVTHPTDICIDRIVMRPLWLEVQRMAANVINIDLPANGIICRFESNLSLMSTHIFRLMKDQLKLHYGSVNPGLKIQYTPMTSQRRMELRLGPRKQVFFTPGFQQFYGVDPMYRNVLYTQLAIPITPRVSMEEVSGGTHLISGSHLAPTFVHEGQQWRVTAEFDLRDSDDISIPVSISIADVKFVPLEAMLHQEQLTLNISTLPTPAVPLRHNRYQILVIARLRQR